MDGQDRRNARHRLDHSLQRRHRSGRPYSRRLCGAQPTDNYAGAGLQIPRRCSHRGRRRTGRAGLLEALIHHHGDHTVLLLSDSQAAVDTALNLCRGKPPRSDIESQLKRQLVTRLQAQHVQDTAIEWVRSHIGIPGNEEADRLATWSSHLGQTTSSATCTVTEGGLQAAGKAVRAAAKKQPTLRLGTAVNWSCHALSAYNWLRTEQGPQKAWLHHVGKTDNPHCPCDGTTAQTGAHITFSCSEHRGERTRLLGGEAPGRRSTHPTRSGWMPMSMRTE